MEESGTQTFTLVNALQELLLEETNVMPNQLVLETRSTILSTINVTVLSDSLKEPINVLTQPVLLANIIMAMSAKLSIALLHPSSTLIDACTRESTSAHSVIIGMVMNVSTILPNAQPEPPGLVFLAIPTVSAEVATTWEALDNAQASLSNALLQPLSMEKDVLVLTMLVQMELMPMEIDVFHMFLVRMDSSGTQLTSDAFVLLDKLTTETPVSLAPAKRSGLLLKDVCVLKEVSILELLVKELTKINALFSQMLSGRPIDVSVELDSLKLASNVSAMELKLEHFAQNVHINPTLS